MENSLKLNIENDSISEKEFLFNFIDYSRNNETPLWNDIVEQFLNEFHKTYYEVEFVRKPKNDVTSNGVTIEESAKSLATSIRPLE